MVIHFAYKNTEAIFQGRAVKRVPLELQQNALRKLQMMHAAISIAELQAMPSLQCKVLGGQPRGQPPLWSIRINQQWRITFTCTEPPLEIRNACFTDYH